jgi:predicted regulator of Ras-like GTPase activity (Roadblock/LC7/MglB family)
MTTKDRLTSILNDAKNAIPEISGALITSTDGMLMSSLASTGDMTRMAAMVATALGLGKRISDSFGGGSFEETTVAGASAAISVFAAGSKAVLAVVYPKGANVGLILLESRNAAQKISEVVV